MPTVTPVRPSLTDRQRKLMDTFQQMGATTEARARPADDIARIAKLPKGQVLGTIQELEKIRLVAPAKTNKTHKYYAVPPAA